MAKDKPGHVPGPWKLRVDKYENYEVIDERGREIADAYWDNEDGPTTGEAKANAELIQAAPELAAACMALVKWENEPSTTRSFEPDKAVDLAKAALKKAGYEV